MFWWYATSLGMNGRDVAEALHINIIKLAHSLCMHVGSSTHSTIRDRSLSCPFFPPSCKNEGHDLTMSLGVGIFTTKMVSRQTPFDIFVVFPGSSLIRGGSK